VKQKFLTAQTKKRDSALNLNNLPSETLTMLTLKVRRSHESRIQNSLFGNRVDNPRLLSNGSGRALDVYGTSKDLLYISG
jgi:hypothetical protein